MPDVITDLPKPYIRFGIYYIRESSIEFAHDGTRAFVLSVAGNIVELRQDADRDMAREWFRQRSRTVAQVLADTVGREGATPVAEEPPSAAAAEPIL